MRKYRLSLAALLTALSVNVLTSIAQKSEYRLQPQDAASRYAFYDGSGPQDSFDNYQEQSMPTVLPPPGSCPGNFKLCYLRIDDVDHDGDIEADDFLACFYALDTGGVMWGNRTLDDELEIFGRLEKRF